MLSHLVCTFISLCLLTNSSSPSLAIDRFQYRNNMTVTVRIKPGHPLRRFVPTHALGAALDGHEQGEIDSMLSPANIREMLSTGLKPLSYRLRTELAGEAWHWNPSGQWSDPERRQGYWISNSGPGSPISVSYGYRLPRRGNTLDQANDDGYSRLDDGDVNSFWKSNPYLDKQFTGESNSRLAQWVLVDLGVENPVDAIRLLWGAPFATRYEIQYGRFVGIDDLSQRLPNNWSTFQRGSIRGGTGGDVTLRLSDNPVTTRFVRVLMEEGSDTAAPSSTDERDRLGYALHEIYVGTLVNGRFRDEVHHAANNAAQSLVYVSSTDPWHREADQDQLIEQPGFDRVFRSGLTNGLPMLTPVPLLYDTPENAAAEIRYLRARGYPVERVEMGEEPDGQFVSPEEYAALYLQFAKAVHTVDQRIHPGGPSFQDIEPGEKIGSLVTGKQTWLRRFLNYLNRRNRLNDYTFFSFEWYPFDDVCRPTAPQLARATDMLTESISQMKAGGLQKAIPLIITEYGYSAFGSRAEIDIEGALLNADIIGHFLSLGGEQTFLYGYEPNETIDETGCSWGNNMLFMLGENGNISYRMPTYYGARLLTQEWAKPGNDVHEIYKTTASGEDSASLVTSYAVFRPDGLWSVMLINKDPTIIHQVRIRFRDVYRGSDSQFKGPVDVYQYSRKQYELSAEKRKPHPIRSEPPEHTLHNESSKFFKLPPYSLTVIRGSVK
jgi:hypothetical protein